MVAPIKDSRGNILSPERAALGTNLIGARNFRGGLPDADANLSFIPMDRRGIGGLAGKYREMMETHVGIAAAVYWAITEGASLPKEIHWPHRQAPDADAERFMDLCRTACLDDVVVYDGMLEGANALWAYPLLDAFMGFGLMTPRLLDGGAVEWYPIAHNAVMLWRPNAYLLGGVRFSTPNGYDEIDAADLVHVVHGFAGAGEFEGRSILRDCLQPFELWKQTLINAGIYNQLSWGFLDISYEPSVSDDDIASFNTFGQQFQDGQRKYLLRPKQVDVEMRYPSGSPPDVIAQLEYLDRQIEKKLNAPLAGISQFGSRAMAETLDATASRKAIAWMNGVFERASRGMFQWLAAQYGYRGKLPIMRAIAAEMTTGLDGWNAYVQGVQAGLLTKGPDDEAWARKIIGAPEVEKIEAAEDAPAPLLVGSLQVAQQVLASLTPSEQNPTPLAPDAAILLLQAAGIQEAAARAMVDAQTAKAASMPAAAPVAATSAPGAPAAAAPQPSVVLDGNIEVPKAIGDAPAFAPASTEARDAMMAESDVDTVPTSEMQEVAERALAWRDEHGRGGTEVGVARARDIKNAERLSPDTVRRMRNYFTRHESDKKAEGFNSGEEGFPSAGRIAWDLWGGDAGAAWAERKVAELDRATDASDSSEDSIWLAASLADHPDVIVPDRVVSAARAALDAHRAATKGRTNDNGALLVARDLAAGKRIAWSRIMRLARYFADEFPRISQSQSFKSRGPVWHAYQLRGGDACREWCRSLLHAYAIGAHQRAARLHDSAASYGDLGDSDSEGVLVLDADGREFVTYRELRPEEQIVSWVALADTRRDLDKQMAARIEGVAQAHRASVRKALANGWQTGERDAIWQHFAAEYQKILTEEATALRTALSGEVAQEAKRAVRAGVVGPAVSGETAAEITALMKQQADSAFARAAALTQQAGETIANRVQTDIENAILGGADMSKWTSRITIEGLASSAFESRNVLESAVRSSTYAATPEAQGMVPSELIRSSVPDKNRCDHCADMDGQKVKPAAYVKAGKLSLPPLPDPKCKGGVGRCRCGWFVIYSAID